MQLLDRQHCSRLPVGTVLVMADLPSQVPDLFITGMAYWVSVPHLACAAVLVQTFLV